MLKVVLDTNVLISGFLYGGNPKKILDFWEEEKFILCTSLELQTELLRILVDKLHTNTHLVQHVSFLLEQYAQTYHPTKHFDLCKDKNDNFLLDLSYESNADYLITGDKKILALEKFHKTRIISPSQFLEESL